LPDTFHIQNGPKQEEATLPVLLNYVLRYAIRKVQEYRKAMKLDETHQQVVDADDVSLLRENINTTKKHKVYESSVRMLA
jgi:hypothetical protein